MFRKTGDDIFYSNFSQTQLFKATEMDQVFIAQQQPDSEKLSPTMTYFTLVKGFVCTAILYLPQSFYKGGYLWSFICLSLSLCLTTICMLKLLEARNMSQAKSYMDIGFKAYGIKGRTASRIFLVISQLGFVIAFIYFICSQVASVVSYFSGKEKLSMWYYGLMCVVIYTPICWIRDLKKFARFHLLADFIILVVIITIVFQATDKLVTDGEGAQLNAVQEGTWVSMIGFSVYLFEGIGIILPVYQITRDKTKFKRCLLGCVFSVCGIYILYGELLFFTYGDQLSTPLITDNLQNNWFTQVIKMTFVINLLITYPLMVAPAFEVIENAFFGNIQMLAKQKYWAENVTRVFLICLTVIVAILLDDRLDQFLAILGSLGCIPIAFTFPALFHLRICSLSKWEKIQDIFVIVVSIGLSIFCTVSTLINWK